MFIRTHRKVKRQSCPSLDLPADQQLEDLFDIDHVLRVWSKLVFPVDAHRVVADQSAGGERHVHVEGLDDVCFFVDTLHNLVDKGLCELNCSDTGNTHRLGCLGSSVAFLSCGGICATSAQDLFDLYRK